MGITNLDNTARTKYDFKKGICLEIGAGEKKEVNFVGMDKRKLPGIDIVHNLEKIPYPLPDSCCFTVLAYEVMEHLKPWLTIDVFNEIWRITKSQGQFVIHTPYAGSWGYWQDPTHCNGFTERTFWYFDPDHFSNAYDIYRPKPWKIEHLTFQVDGFIEVILRKINEEKPSSSKGNRGRLQLKNDSIKNNVKQSGARRSTNNRKHPSGMGFGPLRSGDSL